MHVFYYRRKKNSSLGQAMCQIQSRAVLAYILRDPIMLLEHEVCYMVNFAKKSKNTDGETWGMSPC